MKNYALKRLLQLIPILLAITFLSYGMMRIAGSDVVEQKMENTSGTVSQEMIDNARAELGLDKPFVVQYFTWLGNLLRGDMGTSYVSNKPVFSTFVSKLPATLLLTAVSILLTVLISIPLGIWSAVKQNTATDYVIRTASFIGNSLPNFFVSLLLMYFFAIRLGWFPVISGGVSLQSVALPALTLAIAMSAKYLRQVRATVLDELSKDYVLGARARGVKFSTTLIRSVMKASLVTIITLLTLSIGSLLGGTAIVESIFMWDGVGKLAVDAINMRDYPIIQAYVMWMAIIYVLVNLITDLSARVHSDEKGVHNAAVFASDDLTIRGKGKLSVTSLVGHAVHCKDDLLISGADVTIRSANDGLRGNDAIAVEDSVVSIVADGDGMQTSNDKNGKGNMTLTGSVITITAEKDAFQATGLLQSDGCTLSVRCGEGSVR